MIPVRLELENFLSYRRPVVLDFSGMQLACIAGDNGAGKSSLLDAITWVLFGKCRAPGRDDVVNRAAVRHGDSARVQLDFQLEDQLFRALRIQPFGKTGALELQAATGENTWRSLTEATRSQTQQRLEALLRMSYETFTNASFLLQGRADEFTIKRPGERKRILGELLRVDHWELYKEAATERRRDLEVEQTTLAARLAEIDRELASEPDRQKRLQDAKDEHAALRGQRRTQEQLVQSIQAYQSAFRQQQRLMNTLSANLAQARAAHDRTTNTIRIRQAERADLDKTLLMAQTIEADYAAWRSAIAELSSWDAKAASANQIALERQQAQTEIARQSSRLEQEKVELERRQREVRQRRAQRVGILERHKAAVAQVAEFQTRIETRGQLQARADDLQQRTGNLRGDQTRLREAMDDLKARQDQLQGKEGGRCPLCDQQLTSEHRDTVLHQIRAEGKDLGDRFRENQATLGELQRELALIQAELKRLAADEATLRSAERAEMAAKTQLEQLDSATSEWEQTAAPRLAQVTDQLENRSFASVAMALVSELDLQAQALAYDSHAHDAARQLVAERSAAEQSHKELENALAALAPLEITLQDLSQQVMEEKRQLAALEAQCSLAEKELTQLGPAPDTDLAQAETELNRLREAEVVASRAIGAAEQALSALGILRDQADHLATSQRRSAVEIGNLKSLERAFGRNGIQALLIEHALPAIQESANQLLDRLTGGEMRVTFSTQRQLKSRDATAETLDIHIADSAGERPYEMYSGGEAFRVNFAIRIALSRMLAQRAGTRLQTLVMDEGFGSQDPEGRQRLVEAINIIQADFARVLVITHIESLRDAFPVHIQVCKGPDGSTVSVS